MTGDGATGAPTPDAEDFEWLRLPLPERPALGPRGAWASEHAATSLASSALAIFLGAGTAAFCIWPSARSAIFPIVVFVGLLALAVQSALAWRAARRGAMLLAAHPREPWRCDHRWDPRGETRTWFARMASAYQSRRRRARWVITMGIVIVCVLVAIGSWRGAAAVMGSAFACVAWFAWRFQGAGDARLHFAKFPFHPGERVTLRFGMAEGGATFRRAEFHLCRVVEIDSGRAKFAHGMRIFELSERRPPGALPGPDFDIEVSFDVPANAVGTRLSASPPEYWVLDVLAATSSGPYAVTFLVPIYERPSAPLAEPKAPA